MTIKSMTDEQADRIEQKLDTLLEIMRALEKPINILGEPLGDEEYIIKASQFIKNTNSPKTDSKTSKVYLSQTKAVEQLQSEGFTLRHAESVVRNLPKFPFGERFKVKSTDIRRALEEANQPTPIIKTSIRPITRRKGVNYPKYIK